MNNNITMGEGEQAGGPNSNHAAGDIPRPIADYIIESSASPEAEARRREQWDDLPSQFKGLIDAKLFQIAPTDVDLRGKLSGAVLDILAGLSGAEESRALDEEYEGELSGLASLLAGNDPEPVLQVSATTEEQHSPIGRSRLPWHRHNKKRGTDKQLRHRRLGLGTTALLLFGQLRPSKNHTEEDPSY